MNWYFVNGGGVCWCGFCGFVCWRVFWFDGIDGWCFGVGGGCFGGLVGEDVFKSVFGKYIF